MFFLVRIEHGLMPSSIIHMRMASVFHVVKLHVCNSLIGVMDVLLWMFCCFRCPLVLLFVFSRGQFLEERFLKERHFSVFC